MGQGFARVPQDSTFPPAAPRGRQLGMGSSISTAVRTLYRLPSYAARPRFIDSSTVSHSPAGCRPQVPSRLVFEQKEKKLASRPRPRSQPPQARPGKPAEPSWNCSHLPTWKSNPPGRGAGTGAQGMWRERFPQSQTGRDKKQ